MAESTDARTIDETAQQAAVLVYAVLYNWAAVVHRRVEAIEFIGPFRFRRRVSVDMRVPLFATPLADPEGRPIYWLPLTLLRKRRLTRFDLRDSHGVALPVLTQRQNGAVATAVLIAAAAYVAEKRSDSHELGAVPDALKDDLRVIATARQEQALATWERLGRCASSSDATERLWRDLLLIDKPFMSLARDLAYNFILLTQVQAYPNDRLLFKLAYDEGLAKPELQARLRIRAVAGWSATQVAQIKKMARESVTGIAGTLDVHCVTYMDDAAEATAQPGVRIEAFRQGATGEKARSIDKVTDSRGVARLRLPQGRHVIIAIPPRGVFELNSGVAHSVEISVGETARDAFSFRLFSSLVGRPALREETPPESLLQRLLRGIAWHSTRLSIWTPSVGHAESFHSEVTAPEELKLTRSKLTIDAVERTGAESDGPSATRRTDVRIGGSPRVHLHASDIDQRRSGVVVVNLRPLSSTVLQAATIAAAITSLLLYVTAAKLSHIVAHIGPAATLLLVVPGGLSAYIARPRESLLTTKLVLGLRLMALASGLASLVAAGVIVFGRDSWADATGMVRLRSAWGSSDDVLYWLATFVALLFAILALAWLYTAIEPEARRERTRQRELQQGSLAPRPARESPFHTTES